MYDKLFKLKELTQAIEREAQILAMLCIAERDTELLRAAATKLLHSFEQRNELERYK